MGVGIVSKDKIITGAAIEEGDAILGLASSGIHSNGMTLARKVLLNKFGADEYIDELGRTVGEELLEPTNIYAREIREMLDSGLDLRSLAHITGDGFLNLRRVSMAYGFKIDNPADEVDSAVQIAEKHGKDCYKIGSTFKDPEKTVILKGERLRSAGSQFVEY
jgi:phosphoribosylformylglycinamidine cyclo-ligase